MISRIICITLSLFLSAEAKAQESQYKDLYIQYPDNPGLHIITFSEMTNEEIKSHKQFQSELKDMHKKGYSYSNTEDPQGIFSVNYTSDRLKRHISSIKLAFPYSGLSFVSDQNNLGFYPTYVSQHGSLGIGQFFRQPDIGTCNYKRLNFKLSHDEVRIIANDLTYDVNLKPTQYIIRGSDATGFSAYVDWYDETYIHQLQCGTEKLHTDFIYRAIDLAIRIDQI